MPSQEELLKIKTVANSIQGWTSQKELAALYDAAKACTGKGVMVEIGSWKGKSTVALGLGSQAGRRIPVFAIDPHTGSPDHIAKRQGEEIWTFEEFKRNINAAELTSIVEPILSTSEETVRNWQRPIELLYLDVHYDDYTLGKNDFLSWSPYIVDGGTIALHCTYPSLQVIMNEGQPFHGKPGPRKVLRTLVFGKRGWKNIRIVDSTTFMEKSEKGTGLYDRLKGRKTQLYGAYLVLAHKLYLLCTRIPAPLKKVLKGILAARRRH